MDISSRLDTGTEFIQGLLTDIQRGEIKIPKFQRKFVWSDAQAVELIDSIAHNYPIGSVLLWKTGTKLEAERNIGDFKLPDTAELTPTNYVLDGQQRLTVIYSCLGAPATESGFTAGYDLVTERFLELPETHQVHIFPLRLLYVTSSLLDFRTALKSHPRGEELQKRLDLLIQIFTNYKVPVVTLKDLTVEEVCPIFERINSSGTRLSTYDLMVAATWSTTFDLNDESDKISEALTPKGFGDIDGNTVIKCLSAVHRNSINKEDVLGLRNLSPSEIDTLVGNTREALLKVVDLLTTEFGIYSWDFLPYEALVVILTKIYHDRNALSGSKVKRLKQWFWRSSFNERYRGASENYISNDIGIVQQFVLQEGANPAIFGEPPSDVVLRSVEFRSNNSRSRALILALAKQGPRNLTNGAIVDCTEALSSFNKKQFHHIYPKAYLKRVGSEEQQNSLANICIIAASENNKISDSDPNNYLPELSVTLGDVADTVFVSNHMPAPSAENYAKLDYPSFLRARSVILQQAIALLCNGS